MTTLVSQAVAVVLTAICLKIVTAILPGLRINGLRPALITAMLIWLVGVVIAFGSASLLLALLGMLGPYQVEGWTKAGVALVAGSVGAVAMLAVASKTLRGVNAQGWRSIVLGGVLTEVLFFGFSLAIGQARMLGGALTN
jgi:hypothetical protein